jgi:hypothetical protein
MFKYGGRVYLFRVDARLMMFINNRMEHGSSINLRRGWRPRQDSAVMKHRDSRIIESTHFRWRRRGNTCNSHGAHFNGD